MVTEDLEKARRIVSDYEQRLGQIHLKEELAEIVAEGIALGRRDGLEMAARAIMSVANMLAQDPEQ